MRKLYTIKCIGGFRDGNAYPRPIANNEVLKDVDERLFHRLQQSDPNGFEVLDVKTILPPSTKSKPKQTSEKKAVVEKATAEKEEGSDGIEG